MAGSVKTVKLTAELHSELSDRKIRDSESFEDVIRRNMELEKRTALLSD